MKKTFIAAALVALASTATMAQGNKFDYNVDSFADIQVLRYQVPGFADLSLNQKKLVYCLTEAALQGRDILTDQVVDVDWVVGRLGELMQDAPLATRQEQRRFQGFGKILEASVVCKRHSPSLF